MSEMPPPFQHYLADDAPKPTPVDPDAHLHKRQAVLHVKYTDARGQVLEGDITNQILTVGQRMAVDCARAKMSPGVAPDMMSPTYYGLMFAIAWMSTSIVAGPPWAKNLTDALDQGLVEAIWTQVSHHEDCFFGRSGDQTAG